MAYVNRVLMMGNLTRDPEVKPVASGKSVAKMRLAISERYTNKAGEQAESVCYVDLDAWDQLADYAEKNLHKGSSILAEGRLQLDQWTTQDGQKRSKLRVRLDRLEAVSVGRRPEGGDGMPGRTPVGRMAVADAPVEEPPEDPGPPLDDDPPF
jgi:single-strand DNA-binding protein